MQFKVRGARRDTGEAVAVTVEAASVADATSRANRHGILVERCDPADSSSGEKVPRSREVAEVGPQLANQRPALAPSKSRAGKRLLRVGAIVGATTILLLIAIYFFWIKPQDEARRRTLKEALVQMDETPKMRKTADTQEQTVGDETAQKGVIEPRSFASASSMAKKSRINGEAWVKRNDGVTLPMAAIDVFLLPPSFALPDSQEEIKDAIALLQIRVDVGKGQPSTSADGASAVAAQRLIDLVRPSNHGGRVITDDLVVVSVGIIELKANEAKTMAALTGRRSDASIREMQRTISGESLWKLMTARSLSHVTTTRDGRFQFDAVETGKYNVVCRSFLPAIQAVVYWSDAIDVADGKEISLNFSADKAVVIGY